NTLARVMLITDPCRFVRPSGSAMVPVASCNVQVAHKPDDSICSMRLTLRGLMLMKGRNRCDDLLPTYATSTTVSRNNSNCTDRFQFCEYGTLPLGFAPPAAKPGIARLFRKTNPLASVPRIESSVPEVPCNGGLPDRRIGCVGSAVAPRAEPFAAVVTVTKPPKSGLGDRLLPVSVACEMP